MLFSKHSVFQSRIWNLSGEEGTIAIDEESVHVSSTHGTQTNSQVTAVSQVMSQ